MNFLCVDDYVTRGYQSIQYTTKGTCLELMDIYIDWTYWLQTSLTISGEGSTLIKAPNTMHVKEQSNLFYVYGIRNNVV